MESIDEKKKKRFEFLRQLYEITGGNTEKIIDMRDVSRKMGLDRDARSSLVRYLIGEGLVQWDTSRDLIGSGRSDIRITHRGVVEIEKARSNPEQPTEHFLPVNIICANTIVDTSIQQGGSGNIQVTEYRREDLQALFGIIDSILKDLASFNLTPDDEQRVRADLQTALEQAKSPKPKHDIIRTCLKRAFEILIGTAIALAVQHADKLLPFLQ